MTGAEWIQIVQLITGSITAVAAPFVGYWMWTLRQGVAETKAKIDETKTKVEQTEIKVDESMLRLDGRLTKLLEQTELRVRAETRVQVEAEAKILAEKLVETNRIEWEKQTKDKAVADALVLKTAEDKAQLDEMEHALETSEARRAVETAKAAEAEALAEKKASAPPAPPAMVLDAQPQNVELHVAGTGTFKDAEEELAEKQGEEEKKR